MNRRIVLLAGIAAVSFLPSVFRAREALTETGRLTILRDLVYALANAGDVIESLVDAIRHMVVTGTEGYDVVKARITYNDLVEISALATQLIVSQSILAQDLDQYVAYANDKNVDPL